MPKIANLSVAFVALVHILLLVVEIFFWKEPVIHQRFGFTLEEAIKVAPIVANAGLYNGFLNLDMNDTSVNLADSLPSHKNFSISTYKLNRQQLNTSDESVNAIAPHRFIIRNL